VAFAFRLVVVVHQVLMLAVEGIDALRLLADFVSFVFLLRADVPDWRRADEGEE
jgi:hypothetical protein